MQNPRSVVEPLTKNNREKTRDIYSRKSSLTRRNFPFLVYECQKDTFALTEENSFSKKSAVYESVQSS